jgi:demethylmenaquinone methyltransferase/2-methoxy-6-polyprenyl-1,4-benzoquinol methylase
MMSDDTAGGQDPFFVKGAFSRIADRYVLTNHVLSAGTDIRWRRRVGRIVAGWEPLKILDVATGTGDLALELQRRCGGAEVIGTDFCEEMLAHARARGVRETLVADAMNLPFEDGRFDVCTVAFGLRNMANWEGGLREMARVTRRGGHVLVLDFSLPRGVLRKTYVFYLNRVLPRIAGVITGEREAYEYLAGSIDRFPSGEAMLALFEKAGLRGAVATRFSGGFASIYVGAV